MSDRNEKFETTDPHVVRLKLESDPGKVLYPSQQAFRLMVDVVELLQTRSKSPSG
jgi:hypothetical protein